MNITTAFHSDLGDCLAVVRNQLNLWDEATWQNAKQAFFEFESYEEAAGYHLPLLRQIMIASCPDLLAALRAAFIKRPVTTREERRPPDEPIRYAGRVVRVLSDPWLRKEIGIGGEPDYSVETLGEEDYVDYSDEEALTWYRNALERQTPSGWWVAPETDVSASMADVDELRDILGLFHYAHVRFPLYVVVFAARSDLCKPCFLNAVGHSGFWPAESEWGQTVNVRTHGPGVREALSCGQSCLGPNELHPYAPPSPQDPRWKEYCESRVRILQQHAEEHPA